MSIGMDISFKIMLFPFYISLNSLKMVLMLLKVMSLDFENILIFLDSAKLLAELGDFALKMFFIFLVVLDSFAQSLDLVLEITELEGEDEDCAEKNCDNHGGRLLQEAGGICLWITIFNVVALLELS
jgi:hypothetical protein